MSFVALYALVGILSLMFLISIVRQLYLHRVNIKNSQIISKSYITFNQKNYIKWHRLSHFGWLWLLVNNISDIFRPANPNMLNTVTNVYIDSQAMKNHNNAENESVYLDTLLHNLFPSEEVQSSPLVGQGSVAHSDQTSPPSIYPNATKGILADNREPLPSINEIATTQEVYLNQKEQNPLSQLSGFKKILVSALFGLFYPIFFMYTGMAAVASFGYMLMFLIYPVLAFGLVAYIILQTFVLKWLNCYGAAYISFASTTFLLITNFAILNRLHGSLFGIDDTAWRVISVTIGNALITAGLVAISEFTNRQSSIRR